MRVADAFLSLISVTITFLTLISGLAMVFKLQGEEAATLKDELQEDLVMIQNIITPILKSPVILAI